MIINEINAIVLYLFSSLVLFIVSWTCTKNEKSFMGYHEHLLLLYFVIFWFSCKLTIIIIHVRNWCSEQIPLSTS